MAAQPDISQILAALAQQQSNGTSQQVPTPQQPLPSQPPPNYPPPVVGLPSAPPSAPPHVPYLPQPSHTGSFDLGSIKPVNTGSVSIADAIAKARNIAENRGVQSYDPRAASSAPRDDPRLAGRGHQRSRSRSRSPRRDTYGSNPYRDERREDPRRGGYRRSATPDRNYRGSRDPQSGFRSQDGETETIRVKSSLVGLIIGRNGENLRKVEAETGARVQFIQAKEAHASERQCTISGSTRARENAKQAIYAIIDENGGTPSQSDRGSYNAAVTGRAKVNLPTLREGESSSQIMVPDKTVGLIIGRGGETIKDLQERSGCHVNIVGENKSVNGLRPVNLIGNERATALAKELILEIVESDSRGSGPNAVQQVRDRGSYENTNRSGGSAGAGGGSGGPGGPPGRDVIDKTIRVPSEAVGMIIGKGGETIKDMQRTTGCKINVNQPKPPDVHRSIDLSGTARAMEEAERVIWEKVETVRQRDAAAGRGQTQGGRGGDQAVPQYDAYSQQQQAPPPVPSYGQYLGAAAPQVAPQMPAFQMPVQQAAPQTGAQPSSDQSQVPDPYAAQQWYMQWYAQQMANQQGSAPGTQ